MSSYLPCFPQPLPISPEINHETADHRRYCDPYRVPHPPPHHFTIHQTPSERGIPASRAFVLWSADVGRQGGRSYRDQALRQVRPPVLSGAAAAAAAIDSLREPLSASRVYGTSSARCSGRRGLALSDAGPVKVLRRRVTDRGSTTEEKTVTYAFCPRGRCQRAPHQRCRRKGIILNT